MADSSGDRSPVNGNTLAPSPGNSGGSGGSGGSTATKSRGGRSRSRRNKRRGRQDGRQDGNQARGQNGPHRNGSANAQANGQANGHANGLSDGSSNGSATAEFEGILFTKSERGDGELRDPSNLLRPLPGNWIVPRNRMAELHLRPGVLISGQAKGRSVNRIETVEGGPADQFVASTAIYDATALDPEPMLRLEHDPNELTTRVIDLLAPVGFGQRGLIVAPPRVGKTILLQNIARGIHANYPDVELVLLLIDERPEEVTDMRRNVPGTVYASSNDNTVQQHLELSQLVIERCKRRVEMGANVVILLDSLTRLGRAFNTGGKQGGRTMTGGLDNRALEIPKKLFGAARKLEHGGSLTILATCLIDTGSAMDKVIFEEFKGTGNMELTLDRKMSDQRIYPAIDIAASGTRKEEKLLSPQSLAAASRIRRHLLNMPPNQALKSLLETLRKHPTNQSLFDTVR